MIADAMDKVGKEGDFLEEGKSMETELEVTEGMRLIRGIFLLISQPILKEKRFLMSLTFFN